MNALHQLHVCPQVREVVETPKGSCEIGITLDKPFYIEGDTILANVYVRNMSSKCVRVTAYLMECLNVVENGKSLWEATQPATNRALKKLGPGEELEQSVEIPVVVEELFRRRTRDGNIDREKGFSLMEMFESDWCSFQYCVEISCDFGSFCWAELRAPFTSWSQKAYHVAE